MKLVLVHGFLGASNNWLRVLSKLKEFGISDVITADLRWHAGDANRFEVKPNEEVNTQAVAEDLLLQIQKQSTSGEAVVLLGHSFGLRPVLKIAAHQNTSLNIVSVIAEDSTPILSQGGEQLLRKILSQTPSPFASRLEARKYFDDSFGEGSALSRFLLSNIREVDGEHRWRFDPKILEKLLDSSIDEPLEKEWLSVKVPVHMLVGEDSTHLKKTDAEAWFQKRNSVGLPTSLTFVPDAGHWVHAENLDGFVEELVKVLS